ncbi:ATP-binding protein [Emergencia timonensis]|nr:sensor histidine kinase [Emergencia timonensis]MBS6175690.1 GHKL domain-containing protein [Clostridiales bacterium]MCB6477667.1 GHKL domain-containing protein [Emergencia timonensis]BDF09344.1 hypothetical protein CE91St48_27850 [Emergencia timonensis]BDF13431.1 hypothetical protein CE91St49_27780 [Emergencia timonensis]
MLNPLRYAIINIVMFICLLLTFFSLYAPKEGTKLYKPACVVLIAADLGFMAYVTYAKGLMAANNLLLVIWIVPTFFLFIFFSKYNIEKYIVAYFSSLLSVTLVNSLGFIAVHYFFGWQQTAHLLIRCGLMITVTLVMRRFIKKPFSKALESVDKGWKLMDVVIILFFLLSIIFFVYPKPFTERAGEYGFAVLFIITIYCAIALVICTILNMSKENEKRMAEAQRRNELRIDSIKLEQMEQQYKTMMDTLEQTSVVRHDLAHHFLVIAEYCRRGEYERIPVYLETLNFQNVTDEVKVYCRNYTANIIFSYYAWLSKSENISFACEADLPEDVLPNEMELSVLLGNALENAVEGCRKAGKEKYITAKIRYEKHKLIMDIRNPFDGVLWIHSGTLQSTKEEDLHGYGMKSMQRVVDKYNGYLAYFKEDKEFILQIVLICIETI